MLRERRGGGEKQDGAEPSARAPSPLPAGAPQDGTPLAQNR